MLGTTAHRHIVVPGVAGLHHVVHPVVGTLILVFCDMVAISTAEAIELGNIVGIGRTEGSGIAPLMEHMTVGIPDFEVLRILANLIIHVVFHGRRTFLGSLGGDQNNTISTTGSIDSGRGSILQHIDALNVVGRDIVDRRYLDTVDHIERFIALCDRTTTTNADRHGGSGTTVLRDDVHTGQLTLQGLSDVRNGIGGEFVTRD